MQSEYFKIKHYILYGLHSAIPSCVFLENCYLFALQVANVFMNTLSQHQGIFLL